MKKPKTLKEIQKGLETIQEMVLHRTEQVGWFHDEVTGALGGPARTFALYSFIDIVNMLAALQGIFEPQLKVKAFAAFDRTSESLKARWNDSNPHAAELAEGIIRASAKGLLPEMTARFYQEWKTQKPNQEWWHTLSNPKTAQAKARASQKKKPK
jgi:hypothetical protein